jgi:FixJ family two-component response regulator
MKQDATVFVVDDCPTMRSILEILACRLGLNVELYRSAEEFLARFTPSRPGCLVLDVEMPGMGGAALLEALNRYSPRLPAIVVTATESTQLAIRIMKAGAVDLFRKPFEPDVLAGRIRDAVEQDRRLRSRQAWRAEVRARSDDLTPRQREVMELVVSGKANKEVAAELGISTKTVEAHRAHVMRKMRTDSLAGLVRMAMVAGVV